MPPQPKGEVETLYGGPWGGLDFSRPYNTLDSNFLAPGSINTSQINGFLTSSPWLAKPPYNNVFGASEYVLGISPNYMGSFTGVFGNSYTLVVTNVGVYWSDGVVTAGGVDPLNQVALNLLYTWVGGDLDTGYMVPGYAVSFVQVNGIVYLTGLMLNGIYQVNPFGFPPPVFSQATSYVSADNIIELGGRLFVAQCRFPGGGGTGTSVLPTVAWSGPGAYAGAGPTDPWNPVNQLGGGFNELADVPDQITGLAGIGRSALIFRQNGVSQADPNPGTSNSGLQPYTFYHLWANQQGVGAFHGSVAQYGQTVFFRSSDNCYTISISAGLQPFGNRIIPKIIADARTYENLLSVNTGIAKHSTVNSYWNFASIINIDGQLHYWLTFSAYTMNQDTEAQVYTAFMYDFNVSENGWHFVDIASYLQQSTSAKPFLGFSCPIVQTADALQSAYVAPSPGPGIEVMITNRYILFGAFTGYGTVTIAGYNLAGGLFQFVPVDYDFNSNWITSYISKLYQPLALPQSTIVFRAEVISLGHKITTRRLRVQADNAPLPTVLTNAQQIAQVTFTGSLPNNVEQAFLAWTQNDGTGQPVQFMQGNYPPNGQPIQTYYGSVVLGDEMVQPSIQGYLADATIPWGSLPLFRIATASLILVDTQSTTQ